MQKLYGNDLDLIQIQVEPTEAQSEQVKLVAQQLTDLQSLFSEISDLVVDQGSILDRIDFNILQAGQNIKLANKEIEKTLVYERSWRANGCIGCLV